MPGGDLHTPAGSGDQSKVSATPTDAVGREGWHGRYFEDFPVGHLYEHPLGRTVPPTDNSWPVGPARAGAGNDQEPQGELMMTATTAATPAPVTPGAPEDLLAHVPPGADLIVPVAAGEPATLLDTLETHHDRLDHVRIHRMDPYIQRAYIRGEFGSHLRHVDYYLGPGSRQAYWDGKCDLVPNDFSEMPQLLREATKCTMVLAAASLPDEHGLFSLGTNADYVAALIGEVPFFLEANANMPRTSGSNQVHISQVGGWIRSDRPLVEANLHQPDEADHRIAGFVAERIADGSCLQVGAGRTPNALLQALRSHRDLGIHTEAFSDGLMDLVECGAVTGSRKVHHRNKHVATLCIGSRRLYDWLDDNQSIELLPVDEVNHPMIVAREPNFVSINATTEVDLMGQCASETIAGRPWSSSGGQTDFARGAMWSRGGQGFVVLKSTTSSGRGRIRSQLTPGSAVTTVKNTVDHVVTEYGVARLRGRSIAERARRLIAIAHPDHREELAFNAREFGLLH
jgi:acyl-CoA hydrolase